MKRVLVVGQGGREHAIVRALLRSPQRPEVLCAPGNAGIGRDVALLDIDTSDPVALASAALRERIDLVVVGPEAPLVAGAVDALNAAGVKAFGPGREAARLEGSKSFAKEVMEAAGVPTPSYRVVTGVEEGMAAIERYPVVLKADGLAAGKGVIVATGADEARATLEDLLVARRYGTDRVVVEAHLEGAELSLLALCDGERAIPMAPARDFKRIGDGDTGPNTGGMGAYSPVGEIDARAVAELCAAVHQPVLDELSRRGLPFHGVLYAGLMLTAGGPQVLEFNVRFGDPETQAVLPRLDGDLLDLLERATEPGGLAGVELRWRPETAVCVVLASAGYPATSRSGDEITGVEEAAALGAEVTHAGTAMDGERLVTAGGRVLGVTALALDPAAARAAAYAAADVIDMAGKQLRRDIAADLLRL